ncbi:MAG TPA: phosphatase PAP2 family protein [Lutibacter sp.]|nr:phosphatase PAP2 family protein [Lutibacter sp.]
MQENKSFWSYKLNDWFRDFTSLGNPILLVFVPFIFLGNSSVFHYLLLALLINEIFCSLIKILFPKKRPSGQTYSNLLEKIDAGSFPSIHASRITIVYLTLFSNTESIAIKIAFISVIVLVFLSRVKLKKHFWIDVLSGFIIGVLIWYLLQLILN